MGNDKKKMYFDNSKVEELLTKYVKRGCTSVKLRDEIMSHADELIKNIIRTHHFYQIFPNKDSSSFNELYQVGWCQLEKVLYKYNNSPGSPKVFNMWSQVCKTRILAYLKKEKRDKKNMPSYKDCIIRKHKTKEKSAEEFEEFLEEMLTFFEYDEDLLHLTKCLKEIWEKDDKPYDGLKNKLIIKSGKNSTIVNQFLKILKMNRDEFTINNKKEHEFDNLEADNYYYTDQDQL